MTLSSKEVSAALQLWRGDLHTRWRLYRCDVTGDKIEPFLGAQDVEVTMSNYSDSAWTVKLDTFPNYDYNLFADFLKVEFEIRTDLDDEWTAFPMGVYKFREPKGSHNDRTTWNLTGYSLERVLLEDFKGAYTVPPNTNILSAVRELMNDAGIPDDIIDFPPSTKVNTKQRYYDPLQDPARCFTLRVCNDMLNSYGFYAIHTDNTGRFFTQEFIPTSQERTADVFYTTEEGLFLASSAGQQGRVYGEQMIDVETIEDEYDDTRFANHVTVISKANDRTSNPPIIGEAENHDPNSPFSIENYGSRKSAEPKTYKSIETQADADRLAEAHLERKAETYRRLSIQTGVDPRRNNKEVLMLEIVLSDGEVVATGKWRSTNFVLTEDGMKHDLSKIEESEPPIHRIRVIESGESEIYRTGPAPRGWPLRII